MNNFPLGAWTHVSDRNTGCVRGAVGPSVGGSCLPLEFPANQISPVEKATNQKNAGTKYRLSLFSSN